MPLRGALRNCTSTIRLRESASCRARLSWSITSQAIDVSADVPQNTGSEWNVIELGWSKGTAKLVWNQKALLETPLPQGMPIPAMGRGLDIADNRRRIMPTPIVFGPFKDAALDDLKMSK